MTPHQVYDTYARQCGPIAWAVFTALQRHADASGYCFPSHATIATEIGASRRSVATAVAKLANLGMVKVEIRTTKSNAQTSNGYKILVGMPVPKRDRGPCKIYTPPMQEVHGPHAPDAHEVNVLNNTQRTTTPPTPSPLMNGAAADALMEEEGELEKTLDGAIDGLASKFEEIDTLLDEQWLRRVLRRISAPAMGRKEAVTRLRKAHQQILLRIEAGKAKEATPIHSPRRFAARIVMSEFGGTA
jgi:hypothetical protein